jgi:hypothetical protein
VLRWPVVATALFLIAASGCTQGPADVPADDVATEDPSSAPERQSRPGLTERPPPSNLTVTSGESTTSSGASWPEPEVHSCRLHWTASTRPIVGQWLDAVCALGQTPPQEYLPDLEGRYGNAGFAHFERFQSGIVEVVWNATLAPEATFSFHVMAGGDCQPYCTVAGPAQGTSGPLRAAFSPQDMTLLGDESYVLARADPVVVEADLVIVISLSEAPHLPRDYTAL